MDREGLSKVRQAELLARLSALEALIREQETRAGAYSADGWGSKEFERRLELLRESHRVYRSALVRLLGDGFDDH